MTSYLDRLLDLALLRPRTRNSDEKRYPSFNRRMIAATIDLMLLSMLVAPAVEYAFNYLHGPASISMAEIARRVETT